VSIVDLAVAGGGGFLKGVRILRAFRPLRIISRRWEDLTKHGGFTLWKKKHSYGKSPFLMGTSTINGHVQ
jgi:hypothetical protein